MDSYSQQALTRAFNLAYFIHRDKQPALLIAMGALSKLEVAAAAQDKRLYYTPAGRVPGDAGHHRTRTRVAMSDLHLLQRLVYVESEPYEKKDEKAGSVARLDEEDMIIRFIKHLVRITTRRNSFYVALGLSRLLYQYTTNETAEIYDLIIQDFVQEYGEKVLSSPPSTGFNAIAWYIPGVAFVLGLGVVVMVIRMWRQRDIARVATASAAPPVSHTSATDLMDARLDRARQQADRETEE